MVKFHNEWDNAVEALKTQNVCPSDPELLINYLDMIPRDAAVDIEEKARDKKIPITLSMAREHALAWAEVRTA